MSHLNLEQIDNLIDAAGVDSTKEILEAFWNSTQTLMQNLQSQLESGDLAEARQSAHAIKGSAANIGAVSIQNSASHIETLCKDGSPIDTLDEIMQLQDNFNAAQQALRVHLDNY